MSDQKHFLVAVLDWGLGHATRCVPIINFLQQAGHRVSLAGNGLSMELLRQEFPGLPFYKLEAYNVTYSNSGNWMAHLFWQIPRLLTVINKEHGQVEQIITDNQVDYIISDNRYGCYSKNIPSVFITHQLNLPVPGWIKGVVNFFNHRMINRFSICWVPDDPELKLSGSLSMSKLKTRYIGMQSRFRKQTITEDSELIVALVSGPEHQRTVFENLLVTQLETWPGKSIIVRGLPKGESKVHSTITFINHLASEQLSTLVEQAGVIIARSGYSTLMDLFQLGKAKVILIPTPGQAEQEYLGEVLRTKKMALVVEQKDFQLSAALKELSDCKGFDQVSARPNLLAEAVTDLVSSNE